MDSTSSESARPSEAWFLTTHWSVVLSAREQPSSRSAAALETLCRTYWHPLYAYVRRQGHSSAEAVNAFGRDDYQITAITPTEVGLRQKSNGKEWTVKYGGDVRR